MPQCLLSSINLSTYRASTRQQKYIYSRMFRRILRVKAQTLTFELPVMVVVIAWKAAL